MIYIGKKAIAGSIIASVVLGGAGYQQNNTFAASADTSTKVTDQAASDTAKKEAGDKVREDDNKMGHFRGGFGGGSLIKQTAEVLDLKESDIRTQLEAGKTFAEIAEDKGLTKSAFLQKLIDAETKKIDERKSEGALTDNQAVEQKEKLSDRLEQAIESSDIGRGGHGKESGMDHGMGRFGKTDEIAEILGMTEEKLKEGLEEGKTIAELAAAKGISETDLIQKLKDNMTEPLKQWVNEKHTAPDKKAETTTETEADAT